MPYCEPCQRYHAPSALSPNGSCPSCGAVLSDEEHRNGHSGSADDSERAPWHLKLILVVLVLYLGYRAIQGIVWLLAR